MILTFPVTILSKAKFHLLAYWGEPSNQRQPPFRCRFWSTLDSLRDYSCSPFSFLSIRRAHGCPCNPVDMIPVCALRCGYGNSDHDRTRSEFFIVSPSASDSPSSHPVTLFTLLLPSSTFTFFHFLIPFNYVRPANRPLPAPVLGTFV